MMKYFTLPIGIAERWYSLRYKIIGLDLVIMSSQRDIENLKSWPLDELCEKTAKYLEIY